MLQAVTTINRSIVVTFTLHREKKLRFLVEVYHGQTAEMLVNEDHSDCVFDVVEEKTSVSTPSWEGWLQRDVQKAYRSLGIPWNPRIEGVILHVAELFWTLRGAAASEFRFVDDVESGS